VVAVDCAGENADSMKLRSVKTLKPVGKQPDRFRPKLYKGSSMFDAEDEQQPDWQVCTGESDEEDECFS